MSSPAGNTKRNRNTNPNTDRLVAVHGSAELHCLADPDRRLVEGRMPARIVDLYVFDRPTFRNAYPDHDLPTYASLPKIFRIPLYDRRAHFRTVGQLRRHSKRSECRRRCEIEQDLLQKLGALKVLPLPDVTP